MGKINKIFKTDLALIPFLIGLILTGIFLHVSEEKGSHQQWHAWAVAHVLVSIVFLILVGIHVKQHWGWYKSLFKGMRKGKGVTIFLTILMIFEILTGMLLLIFVDGDGSHIGRLHWIGGFLLSIVALGHFLKRFPRLRKGIKTAFQKHN